jgi:hypothetical protein
MREIEMSDDNGARILPDWPTLAISIGLQADDA